MSSQASLPPELIDLILACITNPTTLRECSLVCRAWVPSCRPRDAVFTSISLGGGELDIDAFLAVIGHPDPEDIDTIRTYVHSIHLVRADYWQDVIQMQTLLELLPTFTALRELSMKFTVYQPLQPFFPSLPCITHLTLNDISYRNFGQFIGLLKRLPGLRHLTLADLTMGASSAIDQYFPELDTLSLSWDRLTSSGGESQLYAWLSRATAVPDLTLTVHDRGDVRPLQAYLQSLRNLVRLHLRPDHTTIDLSTLTQLSYLRLGSSARLLYSYANTMPATLQSLAQQAPLETVVLDLDVPWDRYNAERPEATFERLEAAVDALLESRASLRVLRLNVHCDGHTEVEVDEQGALRLPAGHFHPGTGIGMCFAERMCF
uniref:F-box domain-containing protein n=1 Tax=Mycena chlorophos TaxID=658473 RepID=A0ABQ0KX23_MYCCL|nr:predicted protein [Mycena chlorophos]